LTVARFAPHPARRAAIVTGASSGIGAATARALAAAGHPVVLAARRTERLAELAAELSASGAEAVALPLDLADPAAIDAFAAAADAALGPIEVLVSNAAAFGLGRALEVDPEEFAAIVTVNLSNTARLVARVSGPMCARGRGDLVFVTSDVTRAPRPMMAAYVASKSGMEGYVRALQMELEGSGVRASVVRPGPTLTEMGYSWDPAETTTAIEEWERWGLARHDTFLRPEAVADAVVFAVSARRGVHVQSIEVQPEAPAPAVPEEGAAP